MKQRTKRNWVIVLLVLSIIILFGAVMLIHNFAIKNAFAEESTTSSIEESLSFTLYNNGTEYRVKAKNKKITEVEIPHEYKGLPVTEIVDSAFISCTNLKSVRIPYTITRIGNNAFYNCKNLEEINGMSRVQSIGNNAFATCTKLDKVILPNTIQRLGSTILKSNPNTVYSRMTEEKMSALNPNWLVRSDPNDIIYGDGLVLEEVYNENDKLIGYAIKQEQNLNIDIDFVLGDTFNGLPLLEIESYAFSGCTFRSFTLKHAEIIPDKQEVESQNSINYVLDDEECNHCVNIGSSAFLAMDADYIKLSVDVTFLDHAAYGDFEFENGYSTEVFCAATMRSITLPNNLNIIPSSTFNSCENLREILNVDPNIDANHLSDKIESIGSSAFGGCVSLINLYVPNIKNMGIGVFWDWGNSERGVYQTIHLDKFYEAPIAEEGYNWDEDWLGTQSESVTVKFKTITIIFDKEGGKADVGSYDIQAMYHQDMPEASAPEKDYHQFAGYYSERGGNGTPYYDENMNSVTPWDKKTPTVLYAYWKPYSYSVILDNQGGTGDPEITVYYGQDMPEINKPTKTGYWFDGYFTEPAEGIQYYKDDATGAQKWDLDSDTVTLYAHWTKREYTIKLYPENNTYQYEITATYGDTLPNADKPEFTGYTFKGYFTEKDGEGDRFYDENMQGEIWENEEVLALYASWELTHYTITYKIGDVEVKPNNNEYDSYTIKDEITFNPTEIDGCIFKWSPAKIERGNTGDIIIYGQRDYGQIEIIYKLDGGVNDPNNQTVCTIESEIQLNDPSLDGVNFLGWYLKWSKVVDNETVEGTLKIEGTIKVKDIEDVGGIIEVDGNFTITLEAKWNSKERTYHISEDCESFSADYYQHIILVLPNTSLSKCLITVSPNVSELELRGTLGVTYGIYIQAQDRSENFILTLRNVTIKAPDGYNAVEVKSEVVLHLHSYGINKIIGGDGFNATYKEISGILIPSSAKLGGSDAINCFKLEICFATSLTLQGGNGGHGLNGAFGYPNGGIGGNGGYAVYVAGDYLGIDGNVTLIGGNGGDGGCALLVENAVGGEGGLGRNPVACTDVLYLYIISADPTIEVGKDGEHGYGGLIVVRPPIVGPGIITPPPGIRPFEA